MYHPIQESIDSLLLEQGEYVPIELLLMEGRLLHNDFFEWLNGEVDYLENVLYGDPLQIQNLLYEAQTYVEKLPMLIAHDKQYSFVSIRESTPLKISRNSKLEHIICRCYRKQRDAVQMDLFLDSTATILVNDIVDALQKNEPHTARQQLEKLYDTDPSHNKIGILEQLVTAHELLQEPVTNAQAEINNLIECLTPSADSMFFSQSQYYLNYHWNRLTSTLKALPWDKENPQLHSSFTAMKSQDWETVYHSVKMTPFWQNEPILLHRYAKACAQTRRFGNELSAWFLLSWNFPDHIQSIETDAQWEVRQNWTTFLELEPELEVHDFPAWLILKKSALTHLLDDSFNNDFALNIPLSYQLIQKLIASEQANHSLPDPYRIQLRAELKKENASLFAHYIRNISSSKL